MTDETQPIEKKKGMGTGPKIAIGCGVVAVIAIIVIAIGLITGVQFLSKKAKEAGIDSELLRENPSLAAAKMIVAANPELEMVEVDEDAGTMTIRNKETGETLTADFEDIEKGRISFRTDKGEMSLGADQSQIPDWIPLYQGELNVAYTVSDEETRAGNFTITADAGIDEIRGFYTSRMEEQGFSVESSSLESEGMRTVTLLFANEEDTTNMTVTIREQEGETIITVTYQIEK